MRKAQGPGAWAGLAPVLLAVPGAVVSAVLVAPAAAHAQPENTLYRAAEGATARLRRDARVLPAEAARCANCHEPSRQPGAADSSFGPRLDARLAQMLPRRGGPPSAYGPAALCSRLRTGLDPARILVQRAMPQCEIDGRACAELWQALSMRDPLPQALP